VYTRNLPIADRLIDRVRRCQYSIRLDDLDGSLSDTIYEIPVLHFPNIIDLWKKESGDTTLNVADLITQCQGISEQNSTWSKYMGSVRTRQYGRIFSLIALSGFFARSKYTTLVRLVARRSLFDRAHRQQQQVKVSPFQIQLFLRQSLFTFTIYLQLCLIWIIYHPNAHPATFSREEVLQWG